MDQIKDSIADQHFRRRRTQQTKIRCFLGCFGGGGASEEDEKLPQLKFKSINQSRSWFSCLKLRSKKSPKRTVPVESQSATDEKKFNHEKGRCVLGRSKSKSNKMMSAYDELPAKGDDEILNQPPVAGRSKPKSNKMISACDELPAKGDDEILKQTPVAGEVQHGKANNKTRSAGKGIFLRNSKSMNHIELLEPIIKENHTCKQGATRSSLRKSKSAKTTTTTTTVINQPAGGGGDSQLIRPNTKELSLSLSLSRSGSQLDVAEQQPEITTGHRGENGVDDENRVVKKTDEKNKGGGGGGSGSNIDRVVGISIIVMVLLIMAVWGKLCAILCSSAWLYFYPLLLRANNNNNIKNGRRTQLNVAGQSQTKEESNKSLQLVHGNSQLQKKKVVFEGFL